MPEGNLVSDLLVETVLIVATLPTKYDATLGSGRELSVCEKSLLFGTEEVLTCFSGTLLLLLVPIDRLAHGFEFTLRKGR